MMKIHSLWRVPTLVLLSVLVAVNVYVFGRVTVDDAFITWRYGKNLVESGIWGYNPTTFDLTQAYTNPIYAVLSIIPAWLGIDVVLFFKLVSLASLALPCLLLYRHGMDRWQFSVFYLAFLAVPAAMVHVFSGLETFVFVVLLAGLFVSLLEARFNASVVLAVILLFVRPECWMLVGLVPAYMLFTPAFAPCWRRAFTAASIIGGVFALYVLFHYWHFGHVLPNTFYIKSTVPFAPKVAIYFMAYLLPLAVLWFSAQRRLALLVAAFELPMIVSYSSADLQMNYVGRFAFHVWAPCFMLMGYIILRRVMPNRMMHALATLTTAFTIGLFILYNSVVPRANALIATNYVRMLGAHVAVGKALHDSHAAAETKVFALGDAGATAFQADMIAFDNLGLGSALVAHQGATDEVINQYNPDVVILLVGASGSIMHVGNQDALYDWVRARKMPLLCDTLLDKGYILRVFSKHPVTGLKEVCAESVRLNSLDQKTFFARMIKQPPWHYWHE